MRRVRNNLVFRKILKLLINMVVLFVSASLLAGCDGPTNDLVKGLVMGMVHKEIWDVTGSAESDGRVISYEIINNYTEKDDHGRDVYVYEYEVSVEYDLAAKRAYRNQNGKSLGNIGNFSGVLRLFRKGEGWYVILPKQ